MNIRPMPLSALPVGGQAKVERLCVEEGMRRRLLDLGMVVGTEVACVHRSPCGDPCAYLVRGAVIALRRCDAAHILVCETGRSTWV